MFILDLQIWTIITFLKFLFIYFYLPKTSTCDQKKHTCCNVYAPKSTNILD